MDRWSSRHNWVERAAAYDAELDRVRQEAQNKAVAKVAAKQAETRELTAAKVLEETANLAFAKLTDVASWSNGGLNLVNSKDLPPEVAAAIESIEIRYDKDGNPIKKIKLHGKLGALDLLGRNQKLWGAKEDTSQQTNIFAFFIEAIHNGEFEKAAREKGLLPEDATEIQSLEQALSSQTLPEPVEVIDGPFTAVPKRENR